MQRARPAPGQRLRRDIASASAVPADDPFEIGGFYLDRPHRDRGGFVYACRYDASAGVVRRRSLGTTDWEAAKVELAALVLSAPAGKDGQIPGPGEVMTMAALANYLEGHATTIRSLPDAERACELAKQYLTGHVKNLMAPVSFWTPSRQLEFCRWLRTTFGHAPASIERRLDVICAAFHEMTKIKIRKDPFGQDIETALMTHAPEFVYKRDRIAKELKIPPSKPRHNKLSIEDMARALDELEHEHLFRFAILALNTWARPEAIAEFDPATQRDGGLLYINPLDRAQTNKRRPTITETRCLTGWLDRWGADAPLLAFQGQRVADVKKALGRAGERAGIALTPGSFRHFMPTMVKRLCRGVAREQRSLWMGHVVREGSRTTDNYEAFDPEYLADVALATDYVMLQLQEKCSRTLFAIEVRLNPRELARIGVTGAENVLYLQAVGGGR